MFYDNVDIGTCDFDVADNIFDKNKKYLLVEPMKEYLDRLPIGENIIKENSAISNKSGLINIFYVSEDSINKHNLPLWVKGCNRINEPHITVSRYISENNIDPSIISSKQINVMSFFTLIDKYNIKHIGCLKIDTEGHDHIIFQQAAKLIKENILVVDRLILEYIEAFNNTKLIDDISFSLRSYLPNVEFNCDNLILSK